MVGKKTASDPPSGSTTTVTSSANSPSTSPSVDQDPHQSPHQEAKNRGSIASVDRPPQDPPVLSAVGQSYIKPIFYLERPATNKRGVLYGPQPELGGIRSGGSTIALPSGVYGGQAASSWMAIQSSEPINGTEHFPKLIPRSWMALQPD
ncbi:hypothetical protein EMCRGX_G005637 [Ephydatia muelleri]